MVITAWILLIGFGAIALDSMYSYISGQLTVEELISLMLRIVVSAVSAGVAWVGLI